MTITGTPKKQQKYKTPQPYLRQIFSLMLQYVCTLYLSVRSKNFQEAQDRDRWTLLMNSLMKLRVP